MKTTRREVRWRRRGSALASVLVAIVILLLIGTSLLSLGLHGQTLGIRTSKAIAARCAADAGLVKAVFQMNEKLKVEPWDDSTLPEATNETLPNCGATFSYTVTKGIDSGYIVESIGGSGLAERKVSCTLSLQGPFEPAIFTGTSMNLKNGTVVDGYNYEADEENLQIGTNSIEPAAIDLKTGVTVNGDVVVGVGGDPDVVINSGWATITGESYALTERYQLPPITVPEALQALPSQGTIKDNTVITGSGKYDGINLKNDKIITINGPVTLYIIGDVTLNNSAQLQVLDDDDASLTMYLEGNYEGKHGSAINNLTKDARKLKIYGLDNCNDMRFKNSSDFYGAIYAPNAYVIFDNSADAFGAVAARKFELKNSATFNYDASLRDVSVNDEAVHYVVKQWREE